MKFVKNRWIGGLMAAIVIFSVVYAAAAALGVTADSLSAGQDAVASCDTDGVTTSFTTQYDQTAQGYIVADVTVDGIAVACNGFNIAVTLAKGDWTSLGELTDTISGTTYGPIDVSADGILASDLANIAVSITE